MKRVLLTINVVALLCLSADLQAFSNSESDGQSEKKQQLDPASEQEGRAVITDNAKAIETAEVTEWQCWKQAIERAVVQEARNRALGRVKRPLPKERTVVEFTVIGNSGYVSSVTMKPYNGPLWFFVAHQLGRSVLSFPAKSSSRYAEVTGYYSIKNGEPQFRIDKILLAGDSGDFSAEVNAERGSPIRGK